MAALSAGAKAPAFALQSADGEKASLADALKKVLEPRCEVVGTVVDGRALLEAAAKLNPDIVVLDIAMPRLDGLGFAKRARRDNPALKVLFLSGLQQPPASEEFLQKPFMRRALMSAVQHLLGGD